MITVKDIVRAYLEGHGYDGLYCPELQCGCRTNDLEPCGDMTSACQPGRLRILTQADIDPGCCGDPRVWASCWVIEPLSMPVQGECDSTSESTLPDKDSQDKSL